jgi:hypothetical protein
MDLKAFFSVLTISVPFGSSGRTFEVPGLAGHADDVETPVIVTEGKEPERPKDEPTLIDRF